MSNVKMLDYMLEHDLLELYVDENYGFELKGMYQSLDGVKSGQVSYKGHIFVVSRTDRVSGCGHSGGSVAGVHVIRVVVDEDELTLARLKERERELTKKVNYAEETMQRTRKAYAAADEEYRNCCGDLEVCKMSIVDLKKKLRRKA